VHPVMAVVAMALSVFSVSLNSLRAGVVKTA
jgi:cation transport ATPase